MNCFVFNKKHLAVVLFLLLSSFLSAQENDFYKQIIKESVNMDFLFAPMNMNPNLLNDSTSNYIVLDVNKQPLPHIGYNYRLNSLLLHPQKDSLPVDKEWTISPNMMMPYTNQENFDPNSTETVGDIIANGILTPLAAMTVAPNPIIIFDYLMRIGVLSDEPFVPKEKKKDKALREIKELYGVK
jgi:hypothetical protein